MKMSKKNILLFLRWIPKRTKVPDCFWGPEEIVL